MEDRAEQDRALPAQAAPGSLSPVGATSIPPAFADGAARQLEHGWIVASLIGRLIVFAILGAAAFTALFTAFVVGDFDRQTFVVATASVGAFVVLVLVLAILWPRWEYDRAGYRIRPDRIEAWSGLVFRRSVSVPISRVQYTDVRQGPVQRSNGIATLVVHTAGTISSSVEFPGLPPDLAREVRDWLVAQTGSDAV